jgi:hypothetical protein
MPVIPRARSRIVPSRTRKRSFGRIQPFIQMARLHLRRGRSMGRSRIFPALQRQRSQHSKSRLCPHEHIYLTRPEEFLAGAANGMTPPNDVREWTFGGSCYPFIYSSNLINITPACNVARMVGLSMVGRGTHFHMHRSPCLPTEMPGRS